MTGMAIGMIVLLTVGLGIFTTLLTQKTLVLLGATPDDRFSNFRERIDRVIVYMFGQKRMFKEPKSGLMHAILFWGFCVISLRTITLFAMAFSSQGFEYHLPGLGEGALGNMYALTKDILAFLVLLMVIGAAIRRMSYRPDRLTPSGEAILILVFIGILMLTDFLLDGARFLGQMEAGALSAEGQMSPVGRTFANIYAALGYSAAEAMSVGKVAYWIHCAVILAFLNLLPKSKHFHVITVFFNILFSKTEPAGAIRPIENLEEQETFGVSKVEQFSWKQLLDVYSCTECGRCEVNCPAWHTGKPLSPKVLIKDILENLHHHEKRIISEQNVVGTLVNRIRGQETEPPTADPFTPVEPDLISQVNEDVIWSCTTCRSCEENCPLLITHVDKIIDMRRHLVLMESSFSKEVGQALRNLEQKSNPWGLPIADRGNWATDLDVPTLSENPDAEYLFFVGCAGCYDERSSRVSAAVVRILKEAGIDFAILGKEEGCTGDPARRIGNEYLYQLQAQQNIDTMQGYNVKKVITTCPHCFNTIKNEYPQLGGDFEVEHHTDMVFRFLDEGRITPTQELDLPSRNSEETRVTYHDSCYLGRYNEVYDSPRDTLKAIPGTNVVEMEQSRENGFCCGAGGARWLMEEHMGTRVNQERVRQAMEVKPDVIATACPYCTMMLEDGLNETGEDQVVVADVAELVANSL